MTVCKLLIAHEGSRFQHMTASVTNNGNLSTEQRRAIVALLDTADVAAAAEAANRTERTVYRWLAEDEYFQAALAEREGQAIDEATRRLVTLASKAIDTLEEILDSDTASDQARRLAAQSVLDNLMKLRELRNVEQRLARLEERLL